jgi:hypothetical protein
MSMPDLMPETWEWEEDQDAGLIELSKNSPMPRQEIIELLGNIQTYLNRMGHAGIERLEF